jgi:RNA polymerase sigma factor (sigma-70 family)
MMEVVTVPPFETFYEEHRDAVFGLLARRLGRARAEDAFQETFLRALRGYARLEHGRHLRAWVLTIAERIAIDEYRKPTNTSAHEHMELGLEAPPEPEAAYAELADLTDRLPPTERAAVVLRYGYDLPYDQIGRALGSSEEAARQAASSGVRRLRKEGAR